MTKMNSKLWSLYHRIKLASKNEMGIREDDMSQSDRDRVKILLKKKKVKVMAGSWSGLNWYKA